MDAGLVPSFLHVFWIWRAVGVGCQVAGEGWTPGLVFCSGRPWAGHRWHESAGAPPVIPARHPDSHLLVCGMSPFLPFPVPTAPQSGNHFQRPPDLGFSPLLTGLSASLSPLGTGLDPQAFVLGPFLVSGCRLVSPALVATVSLQPGQRT